MVKKQREAGRAPRREFGPSTICTTPMPIGVRQTLSDGESGVAGDGRRARRREAVSRDRVADPRRNRRAASGVEHALNAALASIDAIYAIEHVNAFNADVASPVDVEEFWRRHGELPGFAAGT